MILYNKDKTRLIGLLLACMFCFTAMAQHGKRSAFDPKRFEADLEQYITINAGLTPSEAARFFPVYREMMKRQRMLFDEMRRFHFVDTRDDKACANAIRAKTNWTSR